MFNRKIRAILIAFGMTVCTAANAEIYSAIAAFHGLENGLAYAHVLNASTLKAAKQDALNQCNREIKKGNGVCEIKQAFAGAGCIALAVQSDGGEYALGKSTKNVGEAKSKALNACNKKSNVLDCRVTLSECTAKIADSGKKDDSSLAGLENAYGNGKNDAQSGNDLAGLDAAYGNAGGGVAQGGDNLSGLDDAYKGGGDALSEEVRQWTQGLDGFEKAFHTDLLKRGKAAQNRGDYDKAIALFQESVNRGNSTANQLVAHAKQDKAKEIARQKAIAEQQRRERERQQQIAAEEERQRELAEQQALAERQEREEQKRIRRAERNRANNAAAWAYVQSALNVGIDLANQKRVADNQAAQRRAQQQAQQAAQQADWAAQQQQQQQQQQIAAQQEAARQEAARQAALKAEEERRAAAIASAPVPLASSCVTRQFVRGEIDMYPVSEGVKRPYWLERSKVRNNCKYTILAYFATYNYLAVTPRVECREGAAYVRAGDTDTAHVGYRPGGATYNVSWCTEYSDPLIQKRTGYKSCKASNQPKCK